MGLRVTKVNELVRRAVSQILHTQYPFESTRITITKASITPNLRKADIYFSVVGTPLHKKEATQFLKKVRHILRKSLGQEIILKFLPELYFTYDSDLEKETHLLQMLDTLNVPQASPPEDLE